MRSNLPSKELFRSKLTPGRPSYELTEFIGAGCNALVFKAHCPELHRTAACKVIPYSNLVGEPGDSERWMREVRAANMVPSSRVVKFFEAGLWPEMECVYLLADYVEGTNLRNFLKKSRTLEMDFVVDFIYTMLDFLRELDGARTSHGDLHAGNIIVEDRSASFVGRKREYRFTDFGVASLATGSEPLDDWQQLGRLIRDLLDKVDYQTCHASERVMYILLRDDVLGKRLLERDRTFGTYDTTPRELHALLESTKQNAARFGDQEIPALTTPFEFLSCEQMGEAHRLLRELERIS